MHVADRASEHRARPAEGDVADELLPDEPVDVVVGADGEARLPPDVRHRLDPRRHRAGAFAEPYELHAVVVDVAGCHHRGAEAADHSDGHPVVPEHRRSGVRAAEAVLDREHERRGADERTRAFGCGRRVHRLRRQHDQLGLARIGRVRGGVDPDGPVAARTLDPQPAVTDRLDQVLAAVDRPDLVAGTRQEPGVHRAHRAGADDRDLHRANSRTGPAGRAPDRGRATRPRAAARPAVP